ncbi:hypothetical protein GE061_009565 [Apolygus lucorum]|uniref:Pre-mRNA-splicing factor Syf1-like N-terminal HAT-repeats domain-containing protein n=1 Tax=Apolygus lucorum TaxID=248454 RepID=A0A8S9Y0K2_APOLU|nr:hypothetical protein GE061_009565 [Apolygus lucorum]
MPVIREKDRKLRICLNEEDVPYEEEILRNPYSIKHWLRYIDFKKDAPKHGVNIIYERALKELPGRMERKEL